MTSYFLAFCWGICILMSLIGWGGAINRILFPQYQVDWGQRAAWGIAFSIIVGGVFNLTWTISRVSILIYLGLGLVYCLADFLNHRQLSIHWLSKPIRLYQEDKSIFIGIAIVCFLVLLRYSASLYPSNLSKYDDYQGYFVFPNKMLQIGSMGADPFSERRIVSSLGGQYLLQTFVLSMLPEEHLHVIDPGIAIIVFIGLLLGVFQEKGISLLTATFILLFFLLTPAPEINTSSLLMASALFFSLFRFLDWNKLNDNTFIANTLIIALLGAANFSLRSNLIPACGILLISSYLFYLVRSAAKVKVLCEGVVVALLVILFLMPWAISMYKSSGTLLYPLLGKGYHGSAYGTFLSPSGNLTFVKVIDILLHAFSQGSFISLLLLAFIRFRLQPWQLTEREASLAILIAAELGAVTIALTTGGEAANRYAFPFAFAAVIAWLVIVLSHLQVGNYEKNKIYKSIIIAMFVIGILFGNEHGWKSAKTLIIGNIENIAGGIKNDKIIASNQEKFQYSRLVESIPEGETILTRLDKPFLLNFRRNNIFIVDNPGAASLPPGMPFFQGSEAMAEYLTSKSIRYIAYSYATEAGTSQEFLRDLLRPGVSDWIRTVVEHTWYFQENLKQLGETRKRIYDDGEIFVLDLLSQKKQD